MSAKPQPGKVPCQENNELALEGQFRAQRWLAVLQKLEADRRLSPDVLPKPIEAKQFGLGDNVRISEFLVERAYLNDNAGTVVTIDANTKLDPKTIRYIATHRGIDFSSRADGAVVSLPITAGTSGKAWAIPGSEWNTINVYNPKTKIIVQYLHNASVAPALADCTAQKPCPVERDTVIGSTGNVGSQGIHLHLQVKDMDGRYLDPDCAFLPPDSPFFGIEAGVQEDLKRWREESKK